MAPTKPKPMIIISQLDGSGTGETMPLLPPGSPPVDVLPPGSPDDVLVLDELVDDVLVDEVLPPGSPPVDVLLDVVDPPVDVLLVLLVLLVEVLPPGSPPVDVLDPPVDVLVDEPSKPGLLTEPPDVLPPLDPPGKPENPSPPLLPMPPLDDPRSLPPGLAPPSGKTSGRLLSASCGGAGAGVTAGLAMPGIMSERGTAGTSR